MYPTELKKIVTQKHTFSGRMCIVFFLQRIQLINIQDNLLNYPVKKSIHFRYISFYFILNICIKSD